MSGLLLLSVFLGVVNGDCFVNDVKCYTDDSSRILPNKQDGDRFTNEYCAQLCSDNKFSFAGTENGNECYCANSIRSDAKASTDCNVACNGNTKETCGGDWAISVYSVNCSGTPVPPPPEQPYLVNPCKDTTKPFHAMPFCDPTLSIDERVKDAVGRMTLAEKINALGTGTGAIQSLGLNAYDWWSEATHGISHVRINEKTPAVTDFAFPITTGMSFNRTLWFKTGAQIGREARALMNVGNAYSTYWAPVINLAREPRWGRNLETPGEDPYLSGEYATAFVKGFQEAPEDEGHVQASACCKHYAANSMESTTENGVHHWRNEFDATVTQQDLIDSYLLPFQACVEKGSVTSLMCSYNAINGVPSCANDWLLDTVARKEWGFDGYITSDCDADADVFNNHHYNPTPEETVRDVLRAGTDVDCGGFVTQHAQSALDKQVITEDDIDLRLAYLFRIRMRLSHFDASPLDSISTDAVCSDYAKSISQDGTRQGTTLIKNSGILPLDASKNYNVAVIGPLGDDALPRSMSSYYGDSHVCDGKFYSIADAVAQYANVTFVKGVPSVTSTDTSGIADAVAAAKAADIVVLAIGSDLSVAAEGRDAPSIALSKAQFELISQVSAAAKQPAIVVQMTHTPLDISEVLSNPKVGAMLHTGQPSVTTLGIGDHIFGKSVPAGRLIQTILPTSYADMISIFDFNMRPGASMWPRPDCNGATPCANGTNPGRTHRFYTGSPVLPFGFGLSYSNFSYNPLATHGPVVSSAPVRSLLQDTHMAGRTFPSLHAINQDPTAPMVSYIVNVTNTGSYDADDVVLGFMTPPNAGKDGIPLQTLFGFERVHVKAGETVSVYLYPSLLDFTAVNLHGTRKVLTGDYKVHFGVQSTAEFGQGYAEHSFALA